ncbi:MAG TPA: saccharopine dehydrogenase NADP-binding domain-containing protein [Steroidobacter sp.]|uniref:saccharopine dehydrogenase family protein n=1 Tax=Steroidobacter sp. TaxID=1978227 RepID=UPI002ED80DE1
MSPPWLLYGANGYTGELIAREAVARGMRPVLAGRSKQQIAKLAAELDCPSAVFDLEDHTALVSTLTQVAAVLHCAGPFSQTAASMMQGCLATHVHYLDITGEIDVFELAARVHAKAERSGIVLCPGVGFDVVPTDCVAARLKQALPDATHLALGFDSRAGLSRGTAKTAIEAAAKGSCVRIDGKLVTERLGSRTRRIDFGAGEKLAVSIPWGDVSTAYYSTGIKNIEVYTATSQRSVDNMRRANLFRPLLRQRWIRELVKLSAQQRITPPDRTQRDNNPTHVWGEARNAAGEVKTARLRTANGYTLTVHSSLGILDHVLNRACNPGFTTPSLLVSADFVSTLPGSSPIRIDP